MKNTSNTSNEVENRPARVKRIDANVNQFIGSVTPRQRNIGFLGRCFNAARLNPLDLEESALQLKAIIFDEDEFSSVEDASVTIPQNVTFRPETGGDRTSRSSVVFSEQDFEREVTERVKLSAGFAPLFSTSISAAFTILSGNSRSARTMFTYTQALVEGPSLSLLSQADGFTGIHTLGEHFRSAIGSLPTNELGQAYSDFISSFGTHYSTTIGLGGLAYQTIRIENSKFFRLVVENVDVAAEAELTFKQVAVGGGASTERKQRRAFEMETEATQDIVQYRGGTPNVSIADWFPTVASNPALISVELEPLYTLLNEQYFPEDQDISIKHNFLKQAIDQFARTGSSTVDIYALTNENELREYCYEGRNGVGVLDTSSWKTIHAFSDDEVDIKQIFTDGSGVIFTVDSIDNLRWYKVVKVGGERRLAEGSGSIISALFRPADAEPDVVGNFAADPDGTIWGNWKRKETSERVNQLRWYRYVGQKGEAAWAPGSGSYFISSLGVLISIGNGILYQSTDRLGRTQYLGRNGEGKILDWTVMDVSSALEGVWTSDYVHKARRGSKGFLVSRRNGVILIFTSDSKVRWYQDMSYDLRAEFDPDPENDRQPALRILKEPLQAPGSGAVIAEDFDFANFKFVF